MAVWLQASYLTSLGCEDQMHPGMRGAQQTVWSAIGLPNKCKFSVCFFFHLKKNFKILFMYLFIYLFVNKKIWQHEPCILIEDQLAGAEKGLLP